MANVKSVSRQLQKEGLPVELVRGPGYHYFVYDDGHAYESESVMVCYFNQLAPAKWLADGRDFAARMAAKIADQEEALAGNKIWLRHKEQNQ